MLLAVAILLLQPLAVHQNLAVPQNLLAPVAALAASAGDSPSVATARAATDSSARTSVLLIPEFDVSGVSFEPGRIVAEPVPANPMVTVIVVPVPADDPAGPDAKDAPNSAAAAEI